MTHELTVGKTSTLTQSLVWAPYGVATVFDTLESLMQKEGLGKPHKWTFPADGQNFADHLDSYLSGARDTRAMEGILQTCAQMNGVDTVNRFLEARGYSIRLTQEELLPGEFHLAAASVIDILVAWAWKGEKIELTIEGTHERVDAVRMEEHYTLSQSGYNPSRLVAEITTKSGTRVFLTNYDKPITDGKILEWVIENIRSAATPYKKECDGIIFPMVDFHYKGVLEGFVGAQAVTSMGQSVRITQALVEQRLRLNEIGARAQQATAMELCNSSGQLPPYKFSGRQLLLWFERPGEKGDLVVYSALITPEHMKNPGTLE